MDDKLTLVNVTDWLKGLTPDTVVFDRNDPLRQCVAANFLKARGYTPQLVGFDFAYILECKDAIMFDDTLADAIHLWSDLDVVTAEQALGVLR